MIITKLLINGYGKFIEKEIILNKGFNFVFGSNESGKSTIQSYILNTLFAFENKNKDSEGRLPDIKKYIPWHSNTYGGSIEVVLDNKNKYKIEKNFNNKVTKIYNSNLEDITSDFNYNKREGVLFGESIFNIDRNTFSNTAFIRQSSTKVYKSNKKDIFDKIINLQESGEENLSVSKAVEVLNKSKTELGHKNTKNRIYNNVTNKLVQLNKELKILERNRNLMFEEQKKKKYLTQEIEELNLEIEEISKKTVKDENYKIYKKAESDKKNLIVKLDLYNQYNNKINQLSETIIKFQKQNILKEQLINIKDKEIVEKLNEISILQSNSKIINDSMDLNDNKKSKIFLYFELFALIISLIMSIILTPYIFIVFILIAFLIGIRLYKNRKLGKNSVIKELIEKTRVKKDELLRYVLNLGYESEDDLNSIEESLDQLFSDKEIMKEVNNQIQISTNQIENYEILQSNILSELKLLSIIELKQKIEVLEAELENKKNISNLVIENIDYKKILEETKIIRSEKQIEHAKITGKLNAFNVDDDNLFSITEEIVKYNTKLNQISKTQKALQYAIDIIEESAREIKLEVVPLINDKMGKIISTITNKKHTQLVTGKNSQLNTDYNNNVRNVWEFSDGTIDQMYLSLRIVAAEIFSKNENLPIIIDEIFAYYDKERIKNTISLLYEMSKEKQIILFTCKEEELQLAKTYEDINIILI